MAVSRRQFLIGGGLAALATTTGLSGCGGGSGGGSSDGSAELAFAWWGNAVRNENTTKLIAAYQTANPTVKISAQPGEFNTYWDKLATQTAGNSTPDVIQMDMNYISEYGTRGALLDLSKYGADTSKFTEGTVDSGKIDDKLVGINAGVNTACIFADPQVFEKAKMELPDDTTWTWDDMMEVAAELSKKADVPIGVAEVFRQDSMFGAFVRQNGKQLFTESGLGFEAADAQAWFDLMLKYQKAGAIGSPQSTGEEAAVPIDQSAIATHRTGLQYANSNQMETLTAAAGRELKILRYPSLTGKATERQAWYKASMLFSASARTKSPEATVAFINWLVNSPESGNIGLAERGIPANADLLTAITPKLSAPQQAVAKFLVDIKPELAETPIAPPAGGNTLVAIMLRSETDVLFGRTSSAEAATKLVDELKSNLKV